MTAEELTNVDLYRNANGKFVARDPDTGDTFPFPFESVVTEEASINDHEVFVQDTEPTDPDVGDVWIDNSEAFE